MIGRCPECEEILETDGYCDLCNKYYSECIKDDNLILCPFCHKTTDLGGDTCYECPFCHENVDEFIKCLRCGAPLTLDGKPWTCEICENGKLKIFRCPNCNELVDDEDILWDCPKCNEKGNEPYGI